MISQHDGRRDSTPHRSEMNIQPAAGLSYVPINPRRWRCIVVLTNEATSPLFFYNAEISDPLRRRAPPGVVAIAAGDASILAGGNRVNASSTGFSRVYLSMVPSRPPPRITRRARPHLQPLLYRSYRASK